MSEGEAAEDSALVLGSIQGRPDAFRRIVEKYQGYVFDLCWRLTGNPQEAEDLAQETFLKLYRNLSHYKPQHRLSNWVYTIALNTCRNHLRRRRILKFLSLDFFPQEGATVERPSPEPTPEQELERREQTLLMERMIAGLPESLREVFVLRYVHRVPDPEIAEILSITMENLRTRIYRAKKLLCEGFSGPLESLSFFDRSGV